MGVTQHKARDLDTRGESPRRTLCPLISIDSLNIALRLFATGAMYAQDLRRPVSEFVVGLNELLSAGVTANDLRWLLRRGLIEHAKGYATDIIPHPTTSVSAGYALTLAGRDYLTKHDMFAKLRVLNESLPTKADVEFHKSDRPLWCADRRELSFNSTIVKQFRVPARNQTKVLQAFQEEDWPDRIDDPLPPIGATTPQQRIRDTSRALNKNQRNSLIRFLSDGTGTGVVWTRLGANPSIENR